MTTQELAVRNGSQAVQQYVAPEDADDYGIPDEELRAPFLAYNAKEGKWTDPITGEITESVRLVLLRRLPPSRIKWNPDLKAPQNERIECRSLDMVYPVDAEQAQAIGAGPSCAECPFSKFELDRNGKPQKSACSEYVNLAVAFADDEEPIPYHVGVKSTGLKAIRKLLQQWKALQVAKRVRGIPGYAIVFELLRGPQTGESALTYYPLAAKMTSDLVPPERWPGLQAFYNVVRGAFIDTTAQVIDDESDIPAGDDGLHVETADELLARLDAEQAPPPSDPEDCHSLPFGDVATGDQLRAMYLIAAKGELTEAQLNEICLEKYGVAPQGLTQAQAGEFITALQDATAPEQPAQTLFDTKPSGDPVDGRKRGNR